MNTAQLRQILSRDKFTKLYFLGVFPSDQLPTRIYQYPSSFVANVDSSTEPGSHWIAFYLPAPHRLEFFDSYGNPPDYYEGAISEFASRFHELEFNPVILQTNTTAVCGQYCIYYLYSRCRGRKLEKILYPFIKQHISNDIRVYNFVWKRFHVRTNFYQ